MFNLKTIFLSLLLFAPTLQAKIYFPAGVTHESVKNTNIQIAWDIHNVLAIKDGKAKFGAIMGNILPILWSKITDDPAWDEINRLSKTHDISGEGHMYVFLKHGNKKLATMAKKAANSYKPRPGMEQLVAQINAAGIIQRLASNIGIDFYANLNLKFKNKHKCNLFDFIKPGKVVDYSIYGPDHLRKRSLSLEICPVGKPEMDFFFDFNKTYNPNNEYIIIFIDDKIENVLAAVAAGWIGIHLDINQKDPMTTLRYELGSLGVFDKKPFSTSLNNGIKYV